MEGNVGIGTQLEQVLHELEHQCELTAGKLLVVGVSTSEVMGNHIGTSGSEGVAESLLQVLLKWQQERSFQLAIQCCEHLNRALVVERSTMEKRDLQEVAAIPVVGAGGAMAAAAFRKFTDAVLVESLRGKADLGLDIGDTLIGMHMREVCVPVRVSLRSIGEAHITLAKSRPKLIGGARAVYVCED
ncbi:TIGR01440 family protein [Mechercharimyces sp. CAU 1602]|uniref:TIGR01440 family protein n=1 Tax=Mechercharimyces sp. CAU 1602 TaxID=2973933 RepID=UPI0021634B6C|nr:TIGR01440 family protein [Mechercharimyces sp. CAU 1602]MCS1352306.1 TIGR01440 family protein [Mechercharimyces sp. CAU 1602]